jgi:sec-independent protein translocase protein TatA
MGIENPIHLIFLAVVALLVLGPKRLPEVARSLGKGIREFREAMSDGSVDGVPVVRSGGEEIEDADVVSVAAPVPQQVDPPEPVRSDDAPDRRPL